VDMDLLHPKWPIIPGHDIVSRFPGAAVLIP
jgi:hypothetical protein